MFGLDGSAASIVIAVLLFVFVPFILNGYLAHTRGKSVVLMLLLTLIFSWIVTLILALMPKVDDVRA